MKKVFCVLALFVLHGSPGFAENCYLSQTSHVIRMAKAFESSGFKIKHEGGRYIYSNNVKVRNIVNIRIPNPAGCPKKIQTTETADIILWDEVKPRLRHNLNLDRELANERALMTITTVNLMEGR